MDLDVLALKHFAVKIMAGISTGATFVPSNCCEAIFYAGKKKEMDLYDPDCTNRRPHQAA